MSAVVEFAPVCGVLAGAVNAVGTVPYVRDTLRGTTRPHRGSWLIWGLLAAIACWSQRADGASWSLVMVASSALVVALVWVLSISRGEGGVGASEVLLMGLAGGGVAGWALSSRPVVATTCVVAADMIGFALTVPKAWRDPDSETLSTYAFAAVAGALAVAAVAAPDPALLLYPAYFCLANAGVSLLIHRRRTALGTNRRVRASGDSCVLTRQNGACVQAAAASAARVTGQRPSW